MMARNTNVPFKGRIQKRKTYHLQIITFGLQRAAGPLPNSCIAKKRRWVPSGVLADDLRFRRVLVAKGLAPALKSSPHW